MTTAVPIYCHGCGAPITSALFYEGGNAYHFGCRPSQQTVIVGSDPQREHADLLGRIAALEAELANMTKERQFLLDYTTGERERKALKRAEQAEAELAKRRTESTNDEVLVEEYRAELAALRARRCETCGNYSVEHDSARFCCNRWTSCNRKESE